MVTADGLLLWLDEELEARPFSDAEPGPDELKRLMEQVKANEQMYTRFRATEAFKELDAEVQKYEAWKKSQRIP